MVLVVLAACASPPSYSTTAAPIGGKADGECYVELDPVDAPLEDFDSVLAWSACDDECSVESIDALLAAISGAEQDLESARARLVESGADVVAASRASRDPNSDLRLLRAAIDTLVSRYRDVQGAIDDEHAAQLALADALVYGGLIDEATYEAYRYDLDARRDRIRQAIDRQLRTLLGVGDGFDQGRHNTCFVENLERLAPID